MRNRTAAAWIIMSCLLLPGCDRQYRDASSHPDGQRVIGMTCQVMSDLRAHGVALQLGSPKTTDYVSIWNPGFTGPELTFLVILKPPTTLTVVAARRCTNCLVGPLLQYQVKVQPEPLEFGGAPAYIPADSLVSETLSCKFRGDQSSSHANRHAAQ